MAAAQKDHSAQLSHQTGLRLEQGQLLLVQQKALSELGSGERLYCPASLCLPIEPACPNAPPEGAAGSAGGAIGASCESGELCRPRLYSGLLTFSDMVDHNLKSCRAGLRML